MRLWEMSERVKELEELWWDLREAEPNEKPRTNIEELEGLGDLFDPCRR